jgi:hydrogenase maturation protein HypF
LWFEGSGGRVEGTDGALEATRSLLAAGGVVAVKGVGGYHLACDATSDAALARLRARKDRPAKAFAVMVADLGAAAELAFISEREAALLIGPERPIVLLHRRHPSALCDGVAPDNPLVGVLLAYTPLHHLLVSAWRLPLVMTSGNLSDEPICYDDRDAFERLGPIADGWLLHDRPIHVPCDDSVVRVAGDAEMPVRRSRGFAPLPVRLPFTVVPTLAVGGELKNAFCLGSGTDAWMSQHIGDMGSLETLDAFERSVGQFAEIYGVRPERLVADAHPGYLSRRWAERRTGTPVVVQHHHAHIAAVMAEHGLAPGERVVGFAFDGTGYGPDGTIWGGEVLIADYDGYERAARLRPVPLPGGDAVVRTPYRVALAHLRAAGLDWSADLPPVRAAPPATLAALDRQLERGFQCVPSSSMGRLFDAVSSLAGVRHTVSYEAQAAIELEAAAHGAPPPTSRYRFSVEGTDVDPSPVLASIVSDLRNGAGPGEIAAAFHEAVADLVADLAAALCPRFGVDAVALSGGVFQNAVLLVSATRRLAALGLRVLTHRTVPPNDGGLALGQLAVAGRP